MFGRKPKQSKSDTIQTKAVDVVMKSMQADDTLYAFDARFESKEYGFSITFPGVPSEETFGGGEGAMFLFGTPDGITYSVMALSVTSSQDKLTVVNNIMDGISDTPGWSEYSTRDEVSVGTDHPALTQTFISNDNTMLINTTYYTDSFYYSVQIQGVYLEHAARKLTSFLDTFRLLEYGEAITSNQSSYQQEYDTKLDKYFTDTANLDLSHNVPVLGEVEYLQRYPTKMNVSYFNNRFKEYLDCFLWLSNAPSIESQTIQETIPKILDTQMYMLLASYGGHDGVAIKSAFLCALLSGSSNNIRSAYMKGKNTTHDTRFKSTHTDQEYIDFVHNQYPLFAAAIEKVEPKRQKILLTTLGYVLYSEAW